MTNNLNTQANTDLLETFELSDRYLNDDNLPVFYDPQEVLWLATWLNRIAIISILIIMVINIPELFQLNPIVKSFFVQGQVPHIGPWIITIIIGGLAVALQCFLTYFLLKSLANVLTILMSMEFASRDIK